MFYKNAIKIKLSRLSECELDNSVFVASTKYISNNSLNNNVNVLEMFFHNVVVSCVLILFAEVVIANKVIEKKKPLKDSDGDGVAKHTFAKLLKTIVNVNEERMEAMEKMTRLQDYMLTKNKLKAHDDDYESMEEEDNRILLTFANLPLLRRSEDETIARAMCNRFNLEKNNVHLWTGQFLKLACHSHSVALCEHACKKSVRNLCEKFLCNLSTRRDLNTECGANCSMYFEHDGKP